MNDTAVPEITAADAGCWLDGAQGWHNTYRVIEKAMAYGFVVNDEDQVVIARWKVGRTEPDDGDIVHEISDEATAYLQERAPEGYEFVWDMGEFSLMEMDDEEGTP